MQNAIGRTGFALALSACVVITACGGGSSGGGGGSSSGSSSSSSSSSSTGVLSSYTMTGSVAPVHDPALIKQGSTWYAFTTDASATQGGFLSIRCSADRKAWTQCGHVFASMPSWVAASVPAATLIWAPEISYFNGRYHLYYSVSSFGSNRSAIGLVTTPTLDQTSPSYGWTDHGAILTSVTSDNFNAIDANILVDSDNRVWMSYGSFWEGIFQREVEPTTGGLKAGTATQLARRAPSVTFNPIEGPSLIKKGSYYYLFVAWDFCCEANPANSTYKIVVGRGTSPNGPFFDKDGVDMKLGGGTILLQGDGIWNAPGGQLVYSDISGDYIAFHARKMSENGYPYLWVNSIDFSSGWPVIQPQS